MAFVASACGADPRDNVDAGTSDATQELCGNGIWDVLTTGHMEDCDQGLLNGTPQARCTKQCRNPVGPVPTPTRSVDLGFPIAKLELLDHDTQSRTQIAVTNFDARGVQVFRAALTTPGVNPRPTLTTLMVESAPVALGQLRVDEFSPRLPAWIEVPPGESPHLYYAEIPELGPPVIHEVPYPFSDGTKPEIVGRTHEEAGLLIVDQSATGDRDLLVAVVLVRSPTDVVTYSLRIASPGGTRGMAIDTGVYVDNVEMRNGARQVVQFFDDPGAFVAIDIRLPNPSDPFVRTGAVQLSEVARGSWPFQVVGADKFEKSCPDAKWPAHPVPLAVMTDTGALYIWQFDRGLEPGETFVAPFARAKVGTRNVNASNFHIGALEPDGRYAMFTDGDCRDLRSTAIAPLRGSYTQPWSISRLWTSYLSSFGADWVASADSILYFY